MGGRDPVIGPNGSRHYIYILALGFEAALQLERHNEREYLPLLVTDRDEPFDPSTRPVSNVRR